MKKFMIFIVFIFVCLILQGESNLYKSNISKNNFDNPLSPQNVAIIENNGIFQLTWDHVISDTLGNPISPDHYSIYQAENLSENDYEIIGITNNNFYDLDESYSNIDISFFQNNCCKREFRCRKP